MPVYEYCLEPLVCVAVGAFGSGLGNAFRVLQPLPRSSFPLCSSTSRDVQNKRERLDSRGAEGWVCSCRARLTREQNGSSVFRLSGEHNEG